MTPWHGNSQPWISMRRRMQQQGDYLTNIINSIEQHQAKLDLSQVCYNE